MVMQNTSSNDQKHLDREVREMLSSLTHRLTDLHHHTNKSSPGSSETNEEHNEDNGVRIITLAGSNTGATLKAELEDESDNMNNVKFEHEALTAYANSNFQAINNSIMLGGSYSCKDPGVHMETSTDFVEQTKRKQHGKKGKTAAKGGDESSSSDSSGSD